MQFCAFPPKKLQVDAVVMAILLLYDVREFRLFLYALGQAAFFPWLDFCKGHVVLHV